MRDFTEIISDTYIDEERKKICMNNIETAVRKKRLLTEPTAREIFAEQIRYISVTFWIGELLFAFVLWGMFHSGIFDELKESEIITAVSAVTACLGAVGISEFQKSFAYKMAELEQVCFLNLRQVWAVKLALLSAVNLLLLAGAAVNISIRTQYRVYETAVYILVPFLISSVVYFRLLFWKEGEKKVLYASAVFLMVLLSFLPSFYKNAYEKACLWIWGIVLALTVVLLGMEVKHVFQKVERGEGLCLNYH